MEDMITREVSNRPSIYPEMESAAGKIKMGETKRIKRNNRNLILVKR